MPEINAYHVNNEEKCSDFLSSQESHLIISDDATYLGSGMYFWDNIGNAHYWKGIQEKNKDDTFLILQCVLDIDGLLDLTDREISSKVNQLWDKFKEKDNSNHNYQLKYLGGKLDYLYATCSYMKLFHIIKAIVKYKYDIIDADIFCDKSYFAWNVRVIYCVKDSCVIKSKDYLD